MLLMLLMLLSAIFCAAQYQIPLLSSPDETVELVAVKMLMSNNTCRFVDIYKSQPHTGVKGNTIVTNVYRSEKSQVYEFIGADTDAILEFALSKYGGCKWDKAYKDFIIQVGKEKGPQNYEIVMYFFV
jgi:hypothetical protein